VVDLQSSPAEGAGLLQLVQERYPALIRIALSTELQSTATTVLLLAQQALIKPCDASRLESALERAVELQALINQPAVRKLVGGIGDLPTLPRVYHELTRVLACDSVDLRDVIGLVQQDQALCAKILRLVNSVAIGFGREIPSMEHAVSYLGTRTIRSLMLAVHVFAAPGTAPTLWLERLQRHALLVGSMARQIAAENRQVAEDAFMAGLLHDVGKLVLAIKHPMLSADLARWAEIENRTLVQVEQDILGVTHAEIGGYLLGLWGLQDAVVEAVANHHNPARVAQRPQIDALTAVYAANILAHEQQHQYEIPGTGKDDPGDRIFDPAYIGKMSLAQRLAEWRRAKGLDGSRPRQTPRAH